LTTRIIEKFAAQRFQYRLGRYHVTELCGCLRRSYLERIKGHDETYKELWIKQRGNALHRQVSYAFQGWKELPVQMTIPAENELIILAGHIDAYDPEEAEMTEFKSTRYVSWQKERGILPHRHHVQQIRVYYTIWTKRYGFPVDTLSIAYMDDETPPTRFEIEPQDITEWLTERTTAFHRAMLRNTIPTAEPGPLCHYCSFKGTCSEQPETF
jgi:CRISPR/Cas system-associated exonuclease Cas4 (RecB family)